MSKQPPPTPTVSAVGPCPTVSKLKDAPALEVYPAPSHHPTTPKNEQIYFHNEYCISDFDELLYNNYILFTLLTYFSIRSFLGIDYPANSFSRYVSRFGVCTFLFFCAPLRKKECLCYIPGERIRVCVRVSARGLLCSDFAFKSISQQL